MRKQRIGASIEMRQAARGTAQVDDSSTEKSKGLLNHQHPTLVGVERQAVDGDGAEGVVKDEFAAP